MIPTESDVAYLAGLMDGEASITMKHNKVQDMWHPEVRIEQYSSVSIIWAQQLFGGRYRTTARGAHTVTWHGASIVPLLEAVLPYLKIKKRLAEVCLEYQLQKNDHPTRALSPEIKELSKTARDNITRELVLQYDRST